MGAQVVDYRVSAIVVLCKDCGNDVGLYPARHKCKPIDRPPMPPLPLKFSDSPSPSEVSSPSTATSMWASLRSKTVEPVPENTEESIYFNNFAQNLPDASEPSQASGKKLWGKFRQNDKWKQMSEKNEKSKQSGKLWEKLIQATQTVHDDKGAESDEDDWDGETHVSRILREYYEKERLPLPSWLFDQRARKKMTVSEPEIVEESSAPARTPSRRRLWDNNAGRELSSRERERQELRQQQQPALPETRIDPRLDTHADNRAENHRRPKRDQYRSCEARDNYADHRRDDYYDEKRGYEDHYNRPAPPQTYSNYQQTQSPTQRYYEEERGYNRAENRYSPENAYYSSSNRYPNSPQEKGRPDRGGYRAGNERYDNYF